ncbi:ROK family transcriptional regulator [Alicyclobacillus fastidiosus]|uniref:ROK family transcriptional regulator n=1 Tax=Alicyclobacillus fastidiosus TaxID=392011 RepID=A0ABV5AB35_9BACL|nr:ROK family transcriptional regulator [Alicyclobacillus fastidiosus]WEH10550.1 ROK family transcriptional regulator [Alicyclobacillus fastidiosus]
MELKKGTLSGIRRLNRSTILQLIRENDPISRAVLAEKLSLSRSVVSIIVDELLADGIIREAGIGESTTQGGRRPVYLGFVPESRFALGIDVGGTKTIMSLVNLAGDIVRKKKIRTLHRGSASIEYIASEAAEFIRNTNIPAEKILGTGIGVPGFVNPDTGLLSNAPGLEIDELDIKSLVAGTLPGPIFVDNDVNMAVIGEVWCGTAKHATNAVMITIGTGIGAGIVVSKQLYRGRRGYAGEIGYFQTYDNPSRPEVGFLEYGPLDAVASGGGIVNMARELLEDYPLSILHESSCITSEQVFAAAESGDVLALRVIDSVSGHLAAALNNVIVLLDPDVVVIGGGVAGAKDLLLDRIRRIVSRMSPIDCSIDLASLGEDAGAVGAAGTVFIQSEYLKLS